MKTLIVFGAVILAAYAAPDGYYKQEYQFKKSSSTYKNNQLETKNDDEGYYGKHGDLNGNAAPQVQQHNQHSEFVSPAVDNLGHSLTTYNDRDLTPDAERAFRDHNILPGTNRQYSQSTYTTRSNLGQITQNLQYDMEQQLREAIRSMKGQSAYGSTQMRSEDMQFLENQLRSNITRQLQQSLHSQYGAQTTRGQSSYSTTSAGGYNPTANYDTNELATLRQQMERDLLKKLHEGARSSYSQSSSSSSAWNSYGTSNTGHTHRDSAEIDDLNTHGQRQIPTSSNYRPVAGNNDFQRPERISYGQTPTAGSQTTYGSNYGQTSQSGSRYYGSSYDRNFPTLSQSQITVNPTKRVTDVLQNVQNDLTQQVRDALSTYQAKYSGSTYTMTNSRPDYNTALDDFRRQLRFNITRKINDELVRTYGAEDIRGEYSFSQNQRNNANYKTADLDDLKQQIENNLINYLETSFRSYESHHQQSRTQYTNSQRDYTQHGPQHTQSLTSDIAQNPSHVRYEPNRSWNSQSSWSSQSSYGSGVGTDGNTQQPVNSQLEQIRAQLQQDLNRQLQSAVYEQKSHSSYNTQSNSQVEQLLNNELRSNLTRRLEETLNQHYGKQGTRGGQSYTISASGTYNPNANYRTEDLNLLRQQLQDDLVRNLQEQLRTSQQSASSGGYNTGYTSQGPARPASVHDAGQVTDDLGQQSIDEFGQDEDDMLQKTMDDTDLEKIQIDSQTKPLRGDIGQADKNKTNPIRQQVEDLGQKYEDLDGLTQQTEDDNFGRYDLGSNSRNYGSLQVGSQRKPALVGQQTEDLGQKVMTDDEYAPVELGSNRNHGNLQTGSQRKPILVGQQTEEFGQQVENQGQLEQNEDFQKPLTDDDFGQIELGSNRNHGSLQVGNQYGVNKVGGQQNQEIGQQTEELGQKIEDIGQQSIDLHTAASKPQVTNDSDDYVDDIILVVKPLVQNPTTAKPSTTTYATYSVYRNRHYPNRYSSGNYLRPTTSSTEKMSIFNQQQEIDRFAEQLAETQGTQDGYNNEFIDHGDYLQHKPQGPQANDFLLPGTNADEDLTQQHQEEDFGALFQNPENDGAPPAMSLSDVHRSYNAQDQYAGGPRGQQYNPYQTSQSRRMPVEQDDFQMPENDHLILQTMPNHYPAQNTQLHPAFDDAQHPVEPEFKDVPYVPSYQQRGRTYSTYVSPAQTPEQSQEQEQDQEITPPHEIENQPNPEEKFTSSEGVEEEEAVTEVVKPLGFWQKVGGKITNSYNTVKQKAKDLVGA